MLEPLSPKDYTLKLEPDFDLDVSLSDAIQQMWDLDLNRLRPGTDYALNVQGGKQPFVKGDEAGDHLFSRVSPHALNRPTYKLFQALLDNYTANTGVSETMSSDQKIDTYAFLKAIMQTAPMQFCHKYLLAKRAKDVPEDPSDFITLMFKIWFELYNRDSNRDSSGFEHVFVGEVKDDKISGFHNWIRFYLEEQKGEWDYRGYVKPKSRSNEETNSDDHVLSLQFRWQGVEKFVGTSFIGVSPEFEFAVYTACFLLGEEDNEIVLKTGTDEFHLNIRCYKIANDKIGTAFPEATAHYD
jgi:poly(U)-specific endoribonuclease